MANADKNPMVMEASPWFITALAAGAVLKPVTYGRCSNASGIMASATMARMAPAAMAVMTAMVAGDADCSVRYPTSADTPLTSAIPPQTPKTYQTLRPARFRSWAAALGQPSPVDWEM